MGIVWPYNLFIAGPAGSGRESTVLDYLERVAARRHTAHGA
jgi:hypothetical protein